MKLIARQEVLGIKNDFDLLALNGIRTFSRDVSNPQELVRLFEQEYPAFNAATYD